jgi:hypothetical protein
MKAGHSALFGAGVVIVGACVLAWVLTRSSSQPTTSPARASPVPLPETYPPSQAPPTPSQEAPRAAAGGSSIAPPAEVAPLRIIRDPSDPYYDAAKLFGFVGGSPIDFFAKEPRDNVWAPQREKDIVELALPAFREVDPNAQIDVECHTGSCRVTVHSRNKYLTDEMGNYPLTCLANKAVPVWGPGIDDEPGAGSDPRSDFYLFFGQETRGRDGMLKSTKVDQVTGEPGSCARYREGWRKRVLPKQPDAGP